LEETLEKYIPKISNNAELLRILSLSKNFVQRLCLEELRPENWQLKKEGNRSTSLDSAELKNETAELDHLDFEIILKELIHLKELEIRYGVKNCNSAFQLNLFGASSKDIGRLSKALKHSVTLEKMILTDSKINSKMCFTLCSGLSSCESLKYLDLSHNSISDLGARAIATLISLENSPCNI
jgi:Leucine-rich repeat (LRR) protein